MRWLLSLLQILYQKEILSKPFTFHNPIKLLVSSNPNNDYISRNNSAVASPSTRSNSKLKISQEFLHIDSYLNVEDSKELLDQVEDSQESKESYSEGNQESKHYEVLNYREIKKIWEKIVETSLSKNLGLESKMKKILELFEYLEQGLEEHPNLEVIIIIRKVKVEILIDFRQYQEWVVILHRLIDYWEEHKKYKEEIAVYNQLGIVYRLQK